MPDESELVYQSDGCRQSQSCDDKDRQMARQRSQRPDSIWIHTSNTFQQQLYAPDFVLSTPFEQFIWTVYLVSCFSDCIKLVGGVFLPELSRWSFAFLPISICQVQLASLLSSSLSIPFISMWICQVFLCSPTCRFPRRCVLLVSTLHSLIHAELDVYCLNKNGLMKWVDMD